MIKLAKKGSLLTLKKKKNLHAIGRCCYGVILSSNISKKLPIISNFLFIVV